MRRDLSNRMMTRPAMAGGPSFCARVAPLKTGDVDRSKRTGILLIGGDQL